MDVVLTIHPSIHRYNQFKNAIDLPLTLTIQKIQPFSTFQLYLLYRIVDVDDAVNINEYSDVNIDDAVKIDINVDVDNGDHIPMLYVSTRPNKLLLIVLKTGLLPFCDWSDQLG